MSHATLRLVPPSVLRPTEEIAPARVGEVIALILDRQGWTQPICVECDTLAVLDGHHRLTAAIQLGLARVPVRLYDYAAVHLTSWRPEITPTREEVLRRALSGRLYPPKTTRHSFGPLEPMAVDLAQLV
ncbi:ParB N-terminal domain-containing protein [Methylobacterium sp. B4]|uniref:ParB N-terminal domain-containing protein n=1 Tax=Methylobacterium sp. B4 TaxID=1938755 RepID=UPI000D774854|nr:ParB N-terminal domain-containing protein [Methylobacterium sp. B4]PXW65328.1 ParB-like nuclease family protein [Methylobacterium sp. B4]